MLAAFASASVSYHQPLFLYNIFFVKKKNNRKRGREGGRQNAEASETEAEENAAEAEAAGAEAAETDVDE